MDIRFVLLLADQYLGLYKTYWPQVIFLGARFLVYFFYLKMSIRLVFRDMPKSKNCIHLTPFLFYFVIEWLIDYLIPNMIKVICQMIVNVLNLLR